jgi:hypothetical protein
VTDATRARLNFAGEWLTAAAFLVTTVLVGALIVRQLRVTPHAVSSPGEAALLTAAASASTVPSDAVSAPSLRLSAGGEIRVGQARPDALATLDASAKLLKETTERGLLGPREVRSYEGFTLVFEPFERQGEPRVAAIYLH